MLYHNDLSTQEWKHLFELLLLAYCSFQLVYHHSHQEFVNVNCRRCGDSCFFVEIARFIHGFIFSMVLEEKPFVS